MKKNKKEGFELERNEGIGELMKRIDKKTPKEKKEETTNEYI